MSSSDAKALRYPCETMPDTDRWGETAVTLPMAELIAEARLPSPWDGLEGQASFDHILAQTIDQLDVMDRVRACQRIDEATDQERRLLIAIACYGWTTSASYEALSRDTGIRKDMISRHANRLKSKEILWITTVHLANGRRLRLFTLSGHFLMLAYRRWRGGEAAIGKSSSAHPSATKDGGEHDAPALGKSSNEQLCELDDLVTNSTIWSPSTLVSSNTDRHYFDKRLTNVPAAPKSRAFDDLPIEPPWFQQFTAQVRRIPAPTPKAVKWLALASLLDPGLDPEAGALGEACARFLDVYSRPRHGPVRSLRSVIRSIYQGLLLELGGGVGPAPVFYATEMWFPEEPEQPELMTESEEYGPRWSELPSAQEPTIEVHGSGKMATPREVWRAVLEDLQMILPRPTFETWLKSTEGTAANGQIFVVEVPTAFAVEWLERRVSHTMQRSLDKVAGSPLQLQLRVRSGGISYAVGKEE